MLFVLPQYGGMEIDMKKKALAIILTLGMLIASCGGSYAATAGKTRITEGELNFYLSSIKTQMSGTELATDEGWQTQEIEGMRAIDFAKERALETAAQNVAYVEIAKYLDISLDENDKNSIKSVKANLVNQYGGQSGYKKFLKTQDITDKFIDMLCESMVYSEKLMNLAVEKAPISEEEIAEAQNKTDSNGYYKAKHILLATIDTTTNQPLSEEDAGKKRTQADALYARVLGGADFDALMNEYSEDPGLAQSPDGYSFRSGEMVPEFESTVASLGMNEVGFVQSDFGYHIIKRLPLDADKAEEQLKSARLENAMSDWKTEAGFVITKNDSVFDNIS